MTNRATEIVSEEQSDKPFASSFLFVAVVFVVVFKAAAILVFTLLTFSVAWYSPYKTFFKELELVLQVEM